jgi:alginate O-acetyltransferase complex protein AlgI
MLFDSLAFLVGFPLFVAVFLATPAALQPGLLLLASLAACVTFGCITCAWLIAITLLGFLLGPALARRPTGQHLAAALAAVLAPLLLLKYTNFFLTSAQSASAWLGVAVHMPHLNLALPVGISFYTFVVAAYLIDVHLGRVQPEQSLTRFALLTAFYPKFIAGPIERAGTFLPQLLEPKRFDYDRVTDGMRIIAGGLFKKLVVADRLAVVVDSVFANAASFNGVALALTTVLYMFQLYYDFAGYSEIAVGAARILGYELTWNFNRPYAARSISDYWRRWHRSLTTWLFDYVFAPLAAALRSWKSGAFVCAMMCTFLVSGLWHGAQWTFVLYGVAHGVALSIEYLTTAPRKKLRRLCPAYLYSLLAWTVTMLFVACADVLFRASSVAEAIEFLRRMVAGVPLDVRFLIEHHFSLTGFKTLIAGLPVLKTELVIAVLGIVCVESGVFIGRGRPFREVLVAQPVWVRWGAYYALTAALLYLGSQNQATVFIYMQF